MKIIKVILHIIILSCFYLIGTWIQRQFELLIPGSIIGMLLLFLSLLLKLVPVQYIEEGSALLIRHLPLLFIPVTVGILQFLDVFAGKGFLLIFITIISTVMVMVVTGFTNQILVKNKEIDN